MKGDHGQTEWLHDLNWSALDHASHVPQLRLCNYYVCVCVCVALLCVCNAWMCATCIQALLLSFIHLG